MIFWIYRKQKVNIHATGKGWVSFQRFIIPPAEVFFMT